MKKGLFFLVIFLSQPLVFSSDFLNDKSEAFQVQGGFVGGEIGRVYTEMKSPIIGDSTYKHRSQFVGLFGGYNFTDWFGLEASIQLPFSAESDLYPEYHESSFGSFNLQPVFMFQMTNRLSFYVKGGLTAQWYSLAEEDDSNAELEFSGAGLVVGSGVKLAVTDGLYVQASIAFSEATLDMNEDDDHHYSHSHGGSTHTHYYASLSDHEPDIDVIATWFAFAIYGHF